MTIADIQRATAQRYHVLVADLVQPDGRGARDRIFVRPRQAAMFIAARRTNRPKTVIARLFNRDHSTVYWAVKAVGKRILADAETRSAVADIERELGI